MSRTYIITVWSDNDRLHELALKAAVEAVESVNHSPVRGARIEGGVDPRTVTVSIAGGHVTVDPERLTAELRY
jgi:hypothetical protein